MALRRRHLKFTVSGIVFTGMYLRDTKDIYLPIEKVLELTGERFPYSSGPNEVIMLKAAAGTDPQELLAKVKRVWQEFTEEYQVPPYAAARAVLDTSGNIQAYYVAELRKQMTVLMLVFGIVCSAGVLLIFCIFYQ